MLSPGTASLRVLSTPELVDHILSELEREELVQPALVNQLWADVARDHIWRFVQAPCELFRILAPLEGHEPTHEFARAPTSSDWQRFLPISRRVRELQMDNTHTDDAGTCLENSCMDLIDCMARSRPLVDIFPNLTTLGWWDHNEPHRHSDRILFLLSPSITVIQLYCHTGDEWYPADTLFDDIIHRCPRLEELCLSAGTAPAPPYKTIEEGVVKILRRLRLTVLELPLYYLSNRMLEAASRCASLQHLTVEHDTWFTNFKSCGNYADALALDFPKLHAGAFPELTHLTLAAALEPLTSMLEDPAFPWANLLELRFRAVQDESNYAVAHLVAVLSVRCPELECLTLHLARPRRPRDVGEADDDEDDEEDVIPSNSWELPLQSEMLLWSTLEQIEFPGLTRLEITHEYALAITDDDVDALAQKLRGLIVLELNGAPGNPEPGTPKLTIRCLYSLATWLHDLVDLTLFLDATKRTDPTLPYIMFQQLERLFLCVSPIEETDRERITLHFARILPLDARLTSERVYVSEWDFTPPIFEPQRLAIWERVEADLKLIMHAKRDWLENPRNVEEIKMIHT